MLLMTQILSSAMIGVEPKFIYFPEFVVVREIDVITRISTVKSTGFGLAIRLNTVIYLTIIICRLHHIKLGFLLHLSVQLNNKWLNRQRCIELRLNRLSQFVC